MAEDTKEIPLDLIDEPPQAMRTEINRDEVFDLAADIKKNGLINPITVRAMGERFEVVAGHRRFLAHRYGGLATIRCIVRVLTDDEAFAVMTSENLARVDVNPVDEAIHVSRLMEKHENDANAVAEIVNRSKEWVHTRVVIAKMQDDVREALRAGKVKLGVALALTEITNDVDRLACVDMAIAQGASVMMAQYWVQQWKLGLFGAGTAQNAPDPNMPDVQRTVVMLTCALDGIKHPATEMTSVLVWRENVGYLEALRVHLEKERAETGLRAGGGEDLSEETR